MNLSINPLTFQSDKIGTAAQQQQFLFKLGSYLSQLQNAVSGTQSNLNNVINANTSNLGAISNTIYNANGALVVSLIFSFSTAITLTLSNLPLGSIVFLSAHNTAAGARTLTITANTPDSVNYTSVLVNLYNTQQNALTGWSVPATTIYFATGVSMTGPALNFVAQ